MCLCLSSPHSHVASLFFYLTGNNVRISPLKCIRIIESFELEETTQGHLVHLPCTELGHPQLIRCSEPLQPDLEHLIFSHRPGLSILQFQEQPVSFFSPPRDAACAAGGENSPSCSSIPKPTSMAKDTSPCPGAGTDFHLVKRRL